MPKLNTTNREMQNLIGTLAKKIAADPNMDDFDKAISLRRMQLAHSGCTHVELRAVDVARRLGSSAVSQLSTKLKMSTFKV